MKLKNPKFGRCFNDTFFILTYISFATSHTKGLFMNDISVFGAFLGSKPPSLTVSKNQ